MKEIMIPFLVFKDKHEIYFVVKQILLIYQMLEKILFLPTMEQKCNAGH